MNKRYIYYMHIYSIYFDSPLDTICIPDHQDNLVDNLELWYLHYPQFLSQENFLHNLWYFKMGLLFSLVAPYYGFQL